MTADATARLDAALARIAATNDRLRIVTALDEGAARRAAADSDARAAAGHGLGPLDGVLVGVKDNIAVAGLPWTAGLGALRDRVAERDATAVARLRAAGAIPFAMLNMHEGALGATTYNPHFGRCLNPLDEALTPGGSSGGSGAAVAAGYCKLALGTDTMGSVRIPAAYCGVMGLKPTRGLIGRGGLRYLAPSLDTIGPLAGDLGLLAEAARVMAGPDPDDPDSRPAPADGGGTAEGVTLGVPRQLAEVDCEPAVLDVFRTALDAARAAGFGVVEVDIAGWEPGPARRGGLLVSEAEGAVALAEALAMPGPDAVSDDLRALLTYGRDLPSARLVEGYARVRRAAAAADRAFAEADLLILPTAPQLPFRHGDPVPANQADLTALASFHGGPALALPVPVPGGRLPGSVQIMGPAFSEARLLAVARRLLDGLSLS